MEYLNQSNEKEISVLIFNGHRVVEKERWNLSETLQRLKVESEIQYKVPSSISNNVTTKVSRTLGIMEQNGSVLYFSLDVYFYLNPKSVMFWLHIGDDQEWLHKRQLMY